MVITLGPELGLASIEEEGATTGYPLWSPDDAHRAAAILLQLLEQEKASAR